MATVAITKSVMTLKIPYSNVADGDLSSPWRTKQVYFLAQSISYNLRAMMYVGGDFSLRSCRIRQESCFSVAEHHHGEVSYTQKALSVESTCTPPLRFHPPDERILQDGAFRSFIDSCLFYFLGRISSFQCKHMLCRHRELNCNECICIHTEPLPCSCLGLNGETITPRYLFCSFKSRSYVNHDRDPVIFDPREALNQLDMF